MTTLTNRGLTLTVDGASTGDLERGLRAAMRIFETADVSPQAAARASFDMEGWSVSHGDADERVPPAGTEAKANLWFEAEEAALAACCEGQPEVPEGAQLSLSV
jgi:hypothetical protein